MTERPEHAPSGSERIDQRVADPDPDPAERTTVMPVVAAVPGGPLDAPTQQLSEVGDRRREGGGEGSTGWEGGADRRQDPDARTDREAVGGDRTDARPGSGPGGGTYGEPGRAGPTARRTAPGRRGAVRSPRTPPASAGTSRRARLAVRKVHPWSVLLLSLLLSLFLGVALLVAVFVLYQLLESTGVLASVNELYAEVTREPGGAAGAPLLTESRVLGIAGLVAAVDVVLLTALATVGALLYNVCAAVTGGIEVTLAEGD